jgi:MFS family permease
LEGIGDNLGAFLGPLLAIVLLISLGIDIRWIFYLAIVPGLLAVLMILLVQERPVAVAAKSKLDISLRHFPKAYWKYLLVIALFGIGNSSNAFLILQTKNIGASLVATVLIYAGFNLVSALISYPAGFLSDRWGRKNVLLSSFVIFFIVYIGFAVTKNVVLIAMLFVFYGLYQGIFRTVGKAFASDFLPDHLRASGVGWYSATVGLLELAASIVAGLLWDQVGHAAVFLYGAASAVIGSVGLLVLIPPKQQ